MPHLFRDGTEMVRISVTTSLRMKCVTESTCGEIPEAYTLHRESSHCTCSLSIQMVSVLQMVSITWTGTGKGTESMTVLVKYRGFSFVIVSWTINVSTTTEESPESHNMGCFRPIWKPTQKMHPRQSRTIRLMAVFLTLFISLPQIREDAFNVYLRTPLLSLIREKEGSIILVVHKEILCQHRRTG